MAVGVVQRVFHGLKFFEYLGTWCSMLGSSRVLTALLLLTHLCVIFGIEIDDKYMSKIRGLELRISRTSDDMPYHRTHRTQR